MNPLLYSLYTRYSLHMETMTEIHVACELQTKKYQNTAVLYRTVMGKFESHNRTITQP